jgi:hypothetical protein
MIARAIAEAVVRCLNVHETSSSLELQIAKNAASPQELSTVVEPAVQEGDNDVRDRLLLFFLLGISVFEESRWR